MNRFACRVLIASALVLPLGACATYDSPDPSEWFSLDFLSMKKKLPGERKPVFPEGVPGVATGVPQELVKGSQPPPDNRIAVDGQGNETQRAAVEPEKPKPKAKPKPAAKPATAATDGQKTSVSARRPDSQQPAAGQWPDPPQPGRPPAAGQWPDSPQQRQPSGGVQWPDPPPTR